MRITARGVPALMALALLASCGGGDDDDGGGGPNPATATVSGTVTNLETSAPLAAATVAIGSVTATSDADGRYTLRGVPVAGAATIRATLVGFDPHVDTIAVPDGGASHDIVLGRQTLFESGGQTLYIPRDVTTVRGVLVSFGGTDTRGIATGVFTNPDPQVNRGQREMRESLLPLLARHQLALLGTERLADGLPSDAAILEALRVAGTATGRSELEGAPFLIYAVSGGAPSAYGFTLRQPERVIGYALLIGATPTFEQRAEARAVPGYVVIAAQDTIVNNRQLRFFFDSLRVEGGLVGFASEPGATHAPPGAAMRGLLVQWLETVLERRLPPGAPRPVTLTPLDETAGWLGNLATGDVAPWAAFGGTRSAASWLPSQATAETWRAFTGITAGALR